MYFARFCVFLFRTTRSNVVVNLTFYGEANAYSRCRKQYRTSYAKICCNHDFRNNRKFSSFGETSEPTRAVVISVLVELDFQPSMQYTYQRSSRWVNPGTNAGTGRDLLILVANSKPGMWGIELLLYFRSKMTRETPTGFVVPPRYLQMKLETLKLIGVTVTVRWSWLKNLKCKSGQNIGYLKPFVCR